jgi:hypothetical protein
MSHFKGHFEGGQDFFDPLNCPTRSEGQFRGQKMSREMAHKVIVTKKNHVPKFLKQWYIGNFMYPSAVVVCYCV